MSSRIGTRNRVEGTRQAMRHDPRAMLSPWPCGGRPRIEMYVDERCASVIVQSSVGDDREKNSSSSSYGEEPEFIHCPKTSSSRAASSCVKWTLVPFSACNLSSSLSVRFPEPVRLPPCGAGGTSGLEVSSASPWEGNGRRVGTAELAVEGRTVDSGWSQSSGG